MDKMDRVRGVKGRVGRAPSPESCCRGEGKEFALLPHHAGTCPSGAAFV